MPIVRSPVQSIVASPVQSALGSSPGGGISSLDDLASYVDFNAKDRTHFDGSGSSWTTCADQGSLGLTWSPRVSSSTIGFYDTAGFNNGAPGSVRRTGTSTDRGMETDNFTASDLPSDACILMIMKPPNSTSNLNCLLSNRGADYYFNMQNGNSGTDIVGGTGWTGSAFVNGVEVTTRNEAHDQAALTDGNETYPFSYFRVTGVDMSPATVLEAPDDRGSAATNAYIARIIIIDQSEYDDNAATIDTLMETLRDEYRTG